MSDEEKLQEACALLAQQVTLAREAVLDDATSDEQAAEAVRIALAAADRLRAAVAEGEAELSEEDFEERMSEAHFDDDTESVICPKCGSTHTRLVEDVSRYMLVGLFAGRLVSIATWPPEINDDGENHRLACKSCAHEWPVGSFHWWGGKP